MRGTDAGGTRGEGGRGRGTGQGGGEGGGARATGEGEGGPAPRRRRRRRRADPGGGPVGAGARPVTARRHHGRGEGPVGAAVVVVVVDLDTPTVAAGGASERLGLAGRGGAKVGSMPQAGPRAASPAKAPGPAAGGRGRRRRPATRRQSPRSPTPAKTPPPASPSKETAPTPSPAPPRRRGTRLTRPRPPPTHTGSHLPPATSDVTPPAPRGFSTQTGTRGSQRPAWGEGPTRGAQDPPPLTRASRRHNTVPASHTSPEPWRRAAPSARDRRPAPGPSPTAPAVLFPSPDTNPYTPALRNSQSLPKGPRRAPQLCAKRLNSGEVVRAQGGPSPAPQGESTWQTGLRRPQPPGTASPEGITPLCRPAPVGRRSSRARPQFNLNVEAGERGGRWNRSSDL